MSSNITGQEEHQNQLLDVDDGTADEESQIGTPSSKKLTMTQAVMNIFNFCIGAGLLMKPYAFALCGIYSFPAMLLAAVLCIYTGSLLGKVVKKYSKNISINQHKRLQITQPKSKATKFKGKSIYPYLAKLSLYTHKYPELSTYGAEYIKIALFSCQTATIIKFIITSYKLLEDIVNYFVETTANNDDNILFAITCMIMISTFLVLSWDGMTWLSYLSAFSVLVISLSMVSFGFISVFHSVSLNDILSENIDTSDHSTLTAGTAAESMSNVESFSITFSLFVMGIQAHGLLPLVYVDLNKDLQTNKQWNKILLFSYGSASLFYTIVGAIGAWLYGKYTNMIILHNIFEWPGGIISPLISFIVFVNIWASFGISGTVWFEVIEKSIVMETNMSMINSDNKKRLFRICCGVLLSGFTYVMREHLVFFIIASCFFKVVGVSLTPPLLMYLVGFYDELSLSNKIFHQLLIVSTICIGVLIVYTNITSLY